MSRRTASLRQRQRHAVLEYEKKEKQDELRRAIQSKYILQKQKRAMSLLETILGSLVLLLIVILLAVVSYIRPDVLPWNQKPIPKLVLVSFFPPWFQRQRDLPRVVGSYAIATPFNQDARHAIRHAIQQRQQLQSAALDVIYYPWEQDRADCFRQEQAARACGDEFVVWYDASPLEMQRDMILWCLLSKGRIQGMMEFEMDLQRPLSPRHCNVAVRRFGKEQQQMLQSLLILCDYSTSTVPSKMLRWFQDYAENLGGGEWNVSDYRCDLEESLYGFIQDDEIDWTLLDAVCGEDRDGNMSMSKRRKLAALCHGDECCDIYDVDWSKTKTAATIPLNFKPQIHDVGDALLLRH